MAPLSMPALARFARLQAGLFVFALSITLMLEANIGLDPWSAVHQGLARHTGLSFGRVVQSVGLLLVLFNWWRLRTRPGLGTLCNMLFIGAWIDWVRERGVVPEWHAKDWQAFVQFFFGIAVNGFATALYIGARFGAGPRDGFILGVSSLFGKSIRVTRIGVEFVLITSALFLGGTIAWGTVFFAILMGPMMQASLRIMRVSTAPHAGSSAEGSASSAASPVRS